ncbi:MAG TPA: Sec-independent protein translocase subunit TatA [Pseudonocardia sp.]
MGNLGGWEILIILGVLVLLFGAKRLPDMARSMGQSARVFKGEMKGLKEDDKVQQRNPEPVQETVVEKRSETPGSAAQ